MTKTMLKHKYSQQIYNKNILIVGPYPPPLGGVAIHAKRVCAKLKQQNNRVHVYNTAKRYKNKISSLFSFIKTLFTIRPDILYYHEPTESIQKLAIVVLCKYVLRYTLVTIDHDCRLLYQFSKRKQSLFRWLMRKIDKAGHAVIIGDSTHKCYLDNNVMPKHYSIESPYLPPDESEEEDLWERTPHFVKDFVAQHTPLITTAIFAPTLYNGQDLYGLDMCIELIARLKEAYPRVGLLCGVCKVETKAHKEHFEKIKREIERRGLEKYFYFYVSNRSKDVEFWPLIKRSDVFVRPSRSDSFGIGIQEALHFGVPAVASNVCKRPRGTVLFEVSK